MVKKCAVLFSGGKDSCLALHKVLNDKKFQVKYLLSIIPNNFDSFMFHKPDLDLLEKQAEMLGTNLLISESKGEEGEELEDLKNLIEKIKNNVDVIIVGGIASSYQGKRIKKICSELGLKFYAPLWDYDSNKIWKESCSVCEIIEGPNGIPVLFQTCSWSGEGMIGGAVRFIFNNQSSASDYRGIQIVPGAELEIYKEIINSFKFLD